MPVRIERQGHVTTVVLSRPAARNAVDGPTAAELADTFKKFEADETARVAVLWGRAAPSARVRTSRPSVPNGATRSPRTATARWVPPGCG